MKYFIILLISVLAVSSCTKKSTSTSSTTPNNLTLIIHGSSYTAMNAKATAYTPTPHLLTISVDIYNSANSIVSAVLTFESTSANTYQIAGSTFGNPTIIETNPSSGSCGDDPNFNPSPAGTLIITHDGSDYVSGNISATLSTSAGILYPVTGNFKINR